PGPTGTAGTTLAELGTGLGLDTDLGHGTTPSVTQCTTRVGLRCSGEGGSDGRGAQSPEHRADHGAPTGRVRPAGHPRRGNRSSLPERTHTLSRGFVSQ